MLGVVNRTSISRRRMEKRVISGSNCIIAVIGLAVTSLDLAKCEQTFWSEGILA